ncbi:MAG TPA: carboxypeptidase-like regulatory domain-containing protein [Alloacidobacterium sp.]|nr:carboxypeptidase-like regulatory domain-containing protein [Alloacidobacterium sp.]
MKLLSFRGLFHTTTVVALCMPLLLSAQDAKRGRKYTPPPPTCKITVTVTRATTGKPVENAGVIFHQIKDGKSEGNMELKTNEDGKAVLDVIPVGDTVRLQIIASGFQTYGADYQLDGATKDIDVKMLRPGKQYSIYEKHDESQVGGQDEVKPSDSSAQPH